jgi:MOSC domain-containing protein YiiM
MIERIIIGAEGSSQPIQLDEAELVAGKGIVGDKNFAKDKWPGQNVTLIEAEEIERFNTAYGLSFSPGSLRRNLVTRGVRLTELVGMHFTIGNVQFFGVELCEPCASLGNKLATTDMTAAEVVKALTHRAGLRADVVSDGFLSVGMPLLRNAQACG